MREISSTDSHVDTCDILERITELEDDHQDDDGNIWPAAAWDVETWNERFQLLEIIEEIGEDRARNGVTLIHENYWVDYVKEYYTDCGSEYYEYNPWTYGYNRVSAGELLSRYPFKFIDWDAVAEDMRSEYSVLTWNGVTFYHESV